MSRLLFALALSVAAGGTVAAAQDAAGGFRGGMGRGPGMNMMRADADGDGTVTRDEYAAQVDQRFARMDANGNGTLDAGEMPVRGRNRMAGGPDAPPPLPPATDDKAPPSPPPHGFAPGTTRDQFRAAAMARFDRMDANRDGKIDRAELMAMVPPGAPGAPPAPPAASHD